MRKKVQFQAEPSCADRTTRKSLTSVNALDEEEREQIDVNVKEVTESSPSINPIKTVNNYVETTEETCP